MPGHFFCPRVSVPLAAGITASRSTLPNKHAPRIAPGRVPNTESDLRVVDAIDYGVAELDLTTRAGIGCIKVLFGDLKNASEQVRGGLRNGGQ